MRCQWLAGFWHILSPLPLFGRLLFSHSFPNLSLPPLQLWRTPSRAWCYKTRYLLENYLTREIHRLNINEHLSALPQSSSVRSKTRGLSLGEAKGPRPHLPKKWINIPEENFSATSSDSHVWLPLTKSRNVLISNIRNRHSYVNLILLSSAWKCK